MIDTPKIVDSNTETTDWSHDHIFYQWVVVDLISKRSVLVMDNATFQKRNDIQKAITDDGHTLEYFPFYSPDMNPSKISGQRLKRKGGGIIVMILMNYLKSMFYDDFTRL